MNSTILKSTRLYLIKNSFVRGLIACQLLVLSHSLWAQDPVDMSTTDPVLIYQLTHQILAEKDSLKIEVFSDGYALLHYPSYMKMAGNYSVQLSQGQMQGMVRALNAPAITSFSEQRMTIQKKSADKKQGRLSFISDSSNSSFEVSRSDKNGQNKWKQGIQCPHLQFDAKQYPNISSLSKLAEVESMLSKLINQSDLQELGDD